GRRSCWEVIGGRGALRADPCAPGRGVRGAPHPRSESPPPPFRRSLSMTLALATMAPRPTAVLTSPRHVIGTSKRDQPAQTTSSYNMTAVRLEERPLTATAGLVWSGDLPRQLQQVLFDAADGITV